MRPCYTWKSEFCATYIFEIKTLVVEDHLWVGEGHHQDATQDHGMEQEGFEIRRDRMWTGVLYFDRGGLDGTRRGSNGTIFLRN